MFLDTPISIFKNARSTEPKTTQLGIFLTSERHLTRVKAVRQADSKEVRDALKKDLPAATISGTFNVRNVDGIRHYNGLICLDFDGKDNPNLTPAQMKATLSEFQEVAYAGLSVSGAGVFAIIPTNNVRVECHAHIVDLLGELFAQNGLNYDKSCKDVCRLRFVSHDPEACWNHECGIFDAQRFLPRLEARDTRPPRPVYVGDKKAPKTGDNTRDRVEAFISEVEAAGQNVTEDYKEWIRIGMAIAGHFGADGESYWMRISQIHPKFDRMEAENKYRNFLQTAKQIKIGTFFHILKTNGIRL